MHSLFVDRGCVGMHACCACRNACTHCLQSGAVWACTHVVRVGMRALTVYRAVPCKHACMLCM